MVCFFSPSPFSQSRLGWLQLTLFSVNTENNEWSPGCNNFPYWKAIIFSLVLLVQCYHPRLFVLLTSSQLFPIYLCALSSPDFLKLFLKLQKFCQLSNICRVYTCTNYFHLSHSWKWQVFQDLRQIAADLLYTFSQLDGEELITIL